MTTFAYGKPDSIEQAVAYLAKGAPNVHLMAGATDLLSEIKDGIVQPGVIVDLAGIPGLSSIRKDAAGTSIGALTTLAEIVADAGLGADYPVLHQAAGAAASPQLRNAGTIGGNLCQRPRCWYYRDKSVVCTKKGGSQCYAETGRNKYHAVFGGGICYAVFPSDLAPALIALGASVVLAQPSGEKVVPLADFYMPPIVNVRKETILTGKEILREVRIPARKANDKSAYVKFIERGAWDFAIASAAVWASMSGGSIRDIRIVCGGVGTIPWRLKTAEDALRGGSASESRARAAAAKAAAEAAPLAENAYKVDVLKSVVTQAVLAAARP